MSLREVVEKIADKMESEGSTRHGEARAVLEKYSESLRLLLLASKGETMRQQSALISPEQQHVAEVLKAREEFRKRRGDSVARDDQGPREIFLSGGPARDAGMTSIELDPPAFGQEILVAGYSYIYGEDGQLHFRQSLKKD